MLGSSLAEGYELIDAFLSSDQIKTVVDELESVQLPNNRGGIRNAEKKFTSIQSLAVSTQLAKQAQQYLDSRPVLVRAILFNKTPENNWLVAWHQDRTVAVSTEFDHSDWKKWSVKDGTHHVQPTLEVLNQMISFRIHLDDTNEQNGCLQVLPNSQKLGVLTHAEIQEYTKKHRPITCSAKAGSLLVMRPHILHRSSKATRPSQRRVLHLEYSSYRLPKGVEWA